MNQDGCGYSEDITYDELEAIVDFDDLDGLRNDKGSHIEPFEEEGIPKIEPGSNSAYVRILEHIINEVTIYEREHFSPDELEVMGQIFNLSYAARYTLSRLVLRKHRWHPISSMDRLIREIGIKGLEKAFDELISPIHPRSPHASEVIDLTDDEPTIKVEEKVDLESLINLMKSAAQKFELKFEDQDMDLNELLHRLSVEQLKKMAKDYRIPLKKYKLRENLVEQLLECSNKQSEIIVAPKKFKDSFKQMKLIFQSPSSSHTQEKRMTGAARTLLGKCLKLDPTLVKLFDKLNVVFYRHTSLLPQSYKIFGPSLLTAFRKRNYPHYNHGRSTNIWRSRDDFLYYYNALRIEREMEDAFEKCVIPNKIQTTVSVDSGASRVKKQVKEDKFQIPEKKRTQRARVAKDYLYKILQDWQLMVENKTQSSEERSPTLERFEPGYVYTRLVEKGVDALHGLKEYSNAVELLDQLLHQRYWRRGKRGHWHDLRAMLLIQFKSKDTEGMDGLDLTVLAKARQGLQDALLDEDTRLVYRPKLVRRLQALEKKMKIPSEERVSVINEKETKLKMPKIVNIIAKRIHHREGSLKVDDHGRPVAEGPKISMITNFFKSENTPVTITNIYNRTVKTRPTWKKTQKSVWLGRDGSEKNVEERALEYYEDLGFKGFHSETRILTTIFALLFWDIMFTEVSGAFETRFQTAPLDLWDDSFYLARKNLIDTRMREIIDGQAIEILQRHDNLYRPLNIWCAGVRWDLCSQQDLVEIVQCIDSKATSDICQLFCEDYGGRCGGVADLIVWNFESRSCKFVEVKGPGDIPSESQKLWFDVMKRSNVDIEICKVYDEKEPPKSTKKRGKSKSVAEESHLEEISDDEAEDDGDDDAEWQQPRRSSITGSKRPHSSMDDESENVSPIPKKRRQSSRI